MGEINKFLKLLHRLAAGNQILRHGDTVSECDRDTTDINTGARIQRDNGCGLGRSLLIGPGKGGANKGRRRATASDRKSVKVFVA